MGFLSSIFKFSNIGQPTDRLRRQRGLIRKTENSEILKYRKLSIDFFTGILYNESGKNQNIEGGQAT